MKPARGVYGVCVFVPKCMMGSVLQGSDLVSSGGTVQWIPR